MLRHSILSAILPAILLAPLAGLSALAQAPQQPPPRPCAALRQVCLQAGFVAQGARAGEGLVIDCIRPIMQGMPQRPRATKPLPAIDPALVEACRAQNPDFGMRNAQGPQAVPPGNAPGSTQNVPPPGPPGPSPHYRSGSQNLPPPGPPGPHPASGQPPQESPPPQEPPPPR